MKFILIITLISLVAVLGCTPVPKQATDDQTETADPSFEEAMAGYEPGEWIENWDDALKYAKEMKRPIFINFTGSDWCGWCVKLTNEVFSQKAFVDFAKEKFILLNLTSQGRLSKV
jgi:thioredoxin-related protein